MMTLERFAALLDAYGADPRRWPAAERAAAERLAAADQRAAALLSEARRVDEVLDGHRAPGVSADLRARVLAAAPTPARARRWAVAAWARLLAPGAGLAAAGVAGLMFGAALGGAGGDTSAQALLAEAEPADELVFALEESS